MHILQFIIDVGRSQTFAPGDLAIIGVLVVLEGLLSIDNALVLGLLARRLPPAQRGRALTYGLAGALVFRLIAIGLASWLMHWRFLNLLGGGYLILMAVRHLAHKTALPGRPVAFRRGRPVCDDDDEEGAKPPARTHSLAGAHAGSVPVQGAPDGNKSPDESRRALEPHGESAVGKRIGGQGVERPTAVAPAPAHAATVSRSKFWMAVLVIELTDLTVAIDSILAAIALVSEYAPARPGLPHPKLWVVAVGGMLGVILMRFAAVVFIKLLDRFGRFEFSAYLLVLIIGLKLVVDWAFNVPGKAPRVDFHSPSSPWFWLFWAIMLACFCVGFIPQRRRSVTAS
jgi:predicted tellurium resistance membrane protein TerC